MFGEIKELVASEYSPQRVISLAATIQGHDRWSTFARYEQSGNAIATRLREAHLDEVEVLEIPADGVTTYGDWTMPMAWDVKDATLEIASPSRAARMLAHYRAEPACLAMWSAPTPPDGIEAQVVLLPEDYAKAANLDVAGKVVFSSQHGGQVRKWAAQHGAVGVITDYPASSSPDLAYGVAWVNAWVDHRGWGYLRTDTPIWGFSLTREAGAALRRQLEGSEPVRVRAVVQSWLYEGHLLAPVGLLRGTSDEEVLAQAHAYEYGAQDNAAGCAVTIEAARTLKALVDRGALPRPRRGIRFLMSWECYGTIPWCIERIQERRNVVAGLVLDDLGGQQDVSVDQVSVVLSPHCQASYVDYAVAAIAKACLGGEDGERYRLTPWTGGTDHTILLDPCFDVPTPWLTDSPAKFHHTSLDVMDNLDPESLRRAGVLAATYLYFLANAGEAEAAWLAEGTAGMWRAEVEAAAQQAEQALKAADSPDALARAWARGRDHLDYVTERGMAAVRSCSRLTGGAATRAIDDEAAGLRGAGETRLQEVDQAARDCARRSSWRVDEPGAPAPARSGTDLVPRRVLPGLLTLCSIPRSRRQDLDRVRGSHDPMWSGELTFALYWADGRRSIGEIERRLRHEFGATEVDLVAYFKLLEELGYIDWASGRETAALE